MASAGRTLLPRFSRSIVMYFKAQQRAMTSETFLWLSRAACRWRSFSSEDSVLVTTAKLHGAMWALAARTSPNFGLSLGGRRHGYSGCGLAAGELGVGHSGDIAGGCSGRHQNGRFLLPFS